MLAALVVTAIAEGKVKNPIGRASGRAAAQAATG
jgi:hypothetical protein